MVIYLNHPQYIKSFLFGTFCQKLCPGIGFHHIQSGYDYVLVLFAACIVLVFYVFKNVVVFTEDRILKIKNTTIEYNNKLLISS